VDVDEAGRDDEIRGVDRARRGLGHLAHGDDAAAAHTHVATPGGRTRAVDDRATGDLQIEHAASFARTRRRGATGAFSPA
jgi:hypothetical protein